MKKMFEIAVFAGLIGVFGAGEVFGMKTSASSKPSSPSSDFTRKSSMFFSDTKQEPAQNQAKFKELRRVFAERSSSSSIDTRSSADISRRRSSSFGSPRESTRVDPSVKAEATKSGAIGFSVEPVTSKRATEPLMISPGGKPMVVKVEKVEKTEEKPELRKTKSEGSLGKTPTSKGKAGSGEKAKKTSNSKAEKSPSSSAGDKAVVVNVKVKVDGKKSQSPKKKSEYDDKKEKYLDRISPARAGAAALAAALGIVGVDAVNDDDDGKADAVVGPASTEQVVEKPVDVSEKQSPEPTSSPDLFAVDDGDGGFGFN